MFWYGIMWLTHAVMYTQGTPSCGIDAGVDSVAVGNLFPGACGGENVLLLSWVMELPFFMGKGVFFLCVCVCVCASVHVCWHRS